MTSSKKETFLPLSRSRSVGSLGDFNRLLKPIRLSTSVSVTTITLRRLSSSCSSSSSSGSLPGDRALRLPIRFPIAPSPNPFPVGGRVSASGGRASDRRASFALMDRRREDISWEKSSYTNEREKVMTKIITKLNKSTLHCLVGGGCSGLRTDQLRLLDHSEWLRF